MRIISLNLMAAVDSRRVIQPRRVVQSLPVIDRRQENSPREGYVCRRTLRRPVPGRRRLPDRTEM